MNQVPYPESQQLGWVADRAAPAAGTAAKQVPGLLGHGWPLADQALISGANFGGTILLARFLSAPEFGAYALAYAWLMLFGGVQSALIAQPHNVLGAVRNGIAYRRYTTATSLGQLILAAAGALIVTAAWGVSVLAGSSHSALLLSLAGAVFAWQLQEFVRRVLYTEGRVPAALGNDLLAYGGQLLLICVAWQHGSLSPARALLCLTAASLVAAMAGCWQLRRSWTSHIDLGSIRENWGYGKWLLAACITSEWLGTQLFLFVAAATLGPASAGVLRAFQTVFGPARIVAQAVSITLPTRLARAALATAAPKSSREWHGPAYAALALLTIYCVFVAIFAPQLLHLTFGDDYALQGGPLRWFSLASWLGYLTIFGASVLRAQQRTRAIFVCEAVSLAVIPLTLPLIPWLGLPGVVLGMIAADLVLVLSLGGVCRKEKGIR